MSELPAFILYTMNAFESVEKREEKISAKFLYCRCGGGVAAASLL